MLKKCIPKSEKMSIILEDSDLKPDTLPVNKIVNGNALDVLKKLPVGSIDCIICSPPYWSQRQYPEESITVWGGSESCKHEWVETPPPRRRSTSDIKNPESKQATVKGSAYDAQTGLWCGKCGAWHGQLGMEPTPFMFVDHLIQIFREIKRILKPTGNVFVVIDDAYAGSGSWSGGSGLKYKRVLRKSLCLVPELFAIRMVYDLGFILRQKIVWSKKTLIYADMETVGNAMPESARDRQPHCWEYVLHFVKKPKYYYDQDAVRIPYSKPLNRWGGDKLKAKGKSLWDEGAGQSTYRDRNMRPNPLGANAPDTILINTEPFPGAHFAIFPSKLVQFLIKVGCPERVCKRCGEPWEKKYVEVDVSDMVDWKFYGASGKGEYNGKAIKDYESTKAQNPSDVKRRILNSMKRGKIPSGWKPSCNCNAGWEGGIVLDPCLGSGTTALVALKMGRRFIGIEIVKEYCEMAERRIKPYMEQKKLIEYVD